MKNKESSITKKEYLIGAVIFFVLFLTLTWILYFFNISSQYGDTTFAAQILENFKRGNFSVSTSFTDSLDLSFKSIWYRSADYVCRQPLTVKPYSGPWGHYYFIMFALTPLTWIFNIYVLIAILQAFIYTSVLFFTFFFARDRKINLFNSILLTLLVTQHPLWQEGLFGQFYFNRLFLPFSAFAIWLMTRKKINYILLSIATILALSVNEIYGISLLLIFFGYGLFFNKKELKKFLILGFISGLFSILSISIIQLTVGPYTTQTGFIKETFSLNILRTLGNFFRNAWSQKAFIYLFVNIIFLGILSFASVQTTLLTLLFLLPNLLVNIGGAEKTGWSTHYHINYFIPLIWVSVIGFSLIKLKNKLILPFMLVLLILISAYINPYNLTFEPKPAFMPEIVIYNFIYFIKQKNILLIYRNKLRDAIGVNSSVSAPEAAVYNLSDHKIYYYPLNIDKVDKVIFRYFPEKKGLEKFSSINYGQQDNNLDKCIRKRMQQNGFDFEHPTIINSWAVIGKLAKNEH